MKTTRSRVSLLFVMAAVLFFFGGVCRAATNKYDATWESLKRYKSVPEWFRDAKFGVYAHWGPVTVGSQNVVT